MLLRSRWAQVLLLLAMLTASLLAGCKSALPDGRDAGTAGAVPRWQIEENWRRLRRGMSEGEVAALLGRPDRKEFGRWRTYWRYGRKTGGPQVMFQVDTKKVDTWEGLKGAPGN